jgi:hypothetical protein
MAVSAREQKLERDYQAYLIKELKKMFPGCIVLKNDTGLKAGISDLTVLWYEHWALLEVKAHEGADQEPNQDYYVEKAQDMCFGAFIYPENEQEVLRGLQQKFNAGRSRVHR